MDGGFAAAAVAGVDSYSFAEELRDNKMSFCCDVVSFVRWDRIKGFRING